MTLTETDIESIESLDFEFEPPCEHSEHGKASKHSGPGFYLIYCSTPCGCHPPKVYYICKSGYELSPRLHCPVCKTAYDRWQVWRVLGSTH